MSSSFGTSLPPPTPFPESTENPHWLSIEIKSTHEEDALKIIEMTPKMVQPEKPCRRQ